MILVSGDGKLARALVDLSSDDIQITKLPKKVMDITDEYEVSEVIKRYMTQPDYPKYFVHTAALTKPMNINDRNPIMSLSTNIVGTANVAKICHKYGIKFIYISTDFVYDSDDKVNEESSLKPMNKYGWSKLGGECAVRMYDNHLILRVSMNKKPFPHPKALVDMKKSLIYIDEAAMITLKLLDEKGTINVGGKSQSVYDFVKRTNKDVGKIYLDNISDVNMAKDCSMNISKMEKIINEL